MLRPSDQDMGKYRKHLSHETRSGLARTVAVLSTECGAVRLTLHLFWFLLRDAHSYCIVRFPRRLEPRDCRLALRVPEGENRVAEGAVYHLPNGFPLSDVPAPRIIAAANVPVE